MRTPLQQLEQPMLSQSPQSKSQSSLRMVSLGAVMSLSKVLMDTFILSRLDLESKALLSTLTIVTVFATVPSQKMMDTLVFCLKENKMSKLTDERRRQKSQSIYVTSQYLSLASGLFSSLSINLFYRFCLSSYSTSQVNTVSQFLYWSILPNMLDVVIRVDQSCFQFDENALAPALFVLGQVARWGGLVFIKCQAPGQSDLLSMVQGYFIASILTWFMSTIYMQGCRPLESQQESRRCMFFRYRQFDMKVAQDICKKGSFEYARMLLDVGASLLLMAYLKKKMTNQAVAMLGVLNSLAMIPVALLGASLELALTKYPNKLIEATIGVVFCYVLLAIGVMSNNVVKKPLFNSFNVTVESINGMDTEGNQWQQANEALLFTIIYSGSLSLKLTISGRLRGEGRPGLSCLASVFVLTMVAVSTQFGLNSVAGYFITFTIANLAACLLMGAFLKCWPTSSRRSSELGGAASDQVDESGMPPPTVHLSI